MRAVPDDDGPDLLGWWIREKNRSRHGRRGHRARRAGYGESLLRFAFYGRMSTEDRQDRVSSGRWQLDFART